MAKVITQETFDEVVRENIVDFSMTPAEARVETVQQFEAQGINLTNIIQDLAINEATGEPLIVESLAALRQHIATTAADGEPAKAAAAAGAGGAASSLHAHLDVLRAECDKSVPHRVLAAKNGTLPLLTALAEAELTSATAAAADSVDGAVQSGSVDVDCNGHDEATAAAADQTLCKLLAALCALINNQPDIFDAPTLVVLMRCLERRTSSRPVVLLALQAISRACLMHEINRQNIMNADIMRFLRPLVGSDSADVVRRLCIVFRFLILDDDVRVEFGKAHDHAKQIAGDVLVELTELMGSE